MAEKTLDTLFHDTLKDIHHAERKILKSLPKMQVPSLRGLGLRPRPAPRRRPGEARDRPIEDRP